MSDEIKPKKRIPKYDRVTLYDDALKRVDGWIKQVEASKTGVSLFRKDILNWFVLNSAEALPAASIDTMAVQFFDQERFLKQALKRVREAKERGENLSLVDIMSYGQSVKPKKDRKPRTPKVRAPNLASSADKNVLPS